MGVHLCYGIRGSNGLIGEGVISRDNFARINSSLTEPYSHPRNLAAGSVRQLDANESRKRYLEFFAFEPVGVETDSKITQMEFLRENGFAIVPYEYLCTHSDEDQIRTAVETFHPREFAYPVDGLIMEYENISYGKGLGVTGHHENR